MNAAPKNIIQKHIKNIFRQEHSEMDPIKDYVDYKKYDYEFNAQKKAQHKHTASGLKEVDKKL